MSKIKVFIKRSLKLSTSIAVYYGYLWKIILKIRFRNHAVILMYHRIIEDNVSVNIQPGMYVRQSSFHKQMEFLKKHFKIISLTELIRLLQNKEDVSGKCVITFDDGWKDNYEFAFPAMKKYHIPATIFLVADYISKQKKFWTDEAYIVLKNLFMSNNHTGIKNIFEKIDIDLRSIEINNMDDSIEMVIDILKTKLVVERDAWLTELKTLQNIDSDENGVNREFLNLNEINEMKENNIYFGSHTMSHKILPQCEKTVMEYEVGQSRKILSAKLGYDVRYFCYPNGDYSQEVITEVQKNEYLAACSTRKDWVDNDAHLHLLPRIGMHDDVSASVSMFVCRLLMIPGF